MDIFLPVESSTVQRNLWDINLKSSTKLETLSATIFFLNRLT
jgi:hypothetical protein